MTNAVRDLLNRYPAWTVWCSPQGRWWALRKDMTWEEQQAGCRATLDADDLDQLTTLICDQEQTAATIAIPQ